MAEITLAPGAEEAGLAVMLADIIRTNLQNKPEREKDFNSLQGNIYIRAEDADVDITLAFEKGKLTVHGGKVGKPKVSIVTDSETLLNLANISIKMGLPYYFDETGRAIIRKLLKRELKLKGLVTHPLALTRLTKIMSVK
jgi:hypothetical protein